MMEVKSEYAEINGTRIRYSIIEGEKDTIFFLNGIFMRIESWIPMIQYFKGFQMVLHDMRCQGKSQHHDSVSFRDHVKDLKALIEELSIDKAHIVGTSYGGEVGMFFALENPDMVKSLTIITATSEISEDMYYLAMRWRKGAESRDPKTFVLSWINDVYSSNFIRRNKGIVDMIARGLKDFNFDGAIALLDSFLELYENPLTPKLNKIEVPTLVIAASEDRVKPPEFSKKIYKEIRGSLYFEIAEAGHAVVVEKPKETSIIVRGFLEVI